MSKKANQKAKLLYLQQILLEETDEKHVLTVQQLIERLAELEIPAERKSLYDDIATLQAFGLDVIATRSRANIYRIGSRLLRCLSCSCWQKQWLNLLLLPKIRPRSW